MTAISYDPTGKALLVGHGTAMSGEAVLWPLARADRASSRPLAAYRHQAQVYAVAVSPGGEEFLTAGQDRSARLWRGDGQPLGRTLWHPAEVRWADFLPNGRAIVTVDFENTFRFWEVARQKPQDEGSRAWG